SANADLRAASSARARPRAPNIQLKIKRFSSTNIAPAIIHESTRSRGFIRSYQAGIIVVFPPIETAHGRWAECEAQPCRIERLAIPDSSLRPRRIDKQWQPYSLRHRRKSAARTGCTQCCASYRKADFIRDVA